jgi:hypothetical protein
MAHGITLKMRKVRRPAPEILAVSTKWDEKGRRRSGDGTTYVNPHKDRTLAGKARRRARRAAR